MSCILAINTADNACSVTLQHNNNYFSKTESALHRQAELLLPFIDDLLKQANLELSELDAIAFSAGPASFTSLRLALSTAQGLAIPYNLPIIPVCSLQALAYGFYWASPPTHNESLSILVCTNAYMGELFWAAFNISPHKVLVEQAACLISPDKLPTLKGDQWIGIGNAWSVYAEKLAPLVDSQIKMTYSEFLPHSAEAIADLAAIQFKQGLKRESNQEILYLRDENAWQKKFVFKSKKNYNTNHVNFRHIN